MEAVWTSETSVCFTKTTQHCITEDYHLQAHQSHLIKKYVCVNDVHSTETFFIGTCVKSVAIFQCAAELS
jgi:hypothetical protein